jgi:hypothetical protein
MPSHDRFFKCRGKIVAELNGGVAARRRIGKVSGGLWTIGERKERGRTAGAAGGGGRVAKVFGWSWLRGSVRGRSRFSRGRGRIGRCAVSVQFLDADNILIRNLPTKLLLLAMLFEMLFEENGAAGIGRKSARRGQKDIAGAILHLDPAPEKGRIAGHTSFSVKGVGNGVNSTEGLVRGRVWKSDRPGRGVSLPTMRTTEQGRFG